jgi:hypothetical protein
MKGFKDSTKTQYSMGGSCYAKGGAVKGAAKVAKVMNEFKSGKLHSGSKEGPEVTNPKQAIAISLSEARKAGAKIPMAKAEGGKVHTYSAKAAAAGKDLGKKGKNFDKIAASAGKEYGSKAAGERVAGAILNKMRKKYEGGGAVEADEGVSTRPTTASGRRISNEELSTPARIMRMSGQADPYERTPPSMAAKKPRSVTVERTTVSEAPAKMTDLQRKLSGPVPRAEMEAARRAAGKGSFRNMPIIRDVADALGLKKGGLAVMPKKGR